MYGDATQQAEKSAAYEADLRAQAHSAGQTMGGAIGNASTLNQATPKRETLRNRMARGVDRMHRDRIRANGMEELVYLLDKNPEVARILDLLEEVGNS